VKGNKWNSYGYETNDELLQILVKLKDSNIEDKTIQEKGDHLGWKSFKMYHTRRKGPNLTTILFYLIFWSLQKIMNQKLSKFSEGLYLKLLQL
jgi:hypothetical protein